MIASGVGLSEIFCSGMTYELCRVMIVQGPFELV